MNSGTECEPIGSHHVVEKSYPPRGFYGLLELQIVFSVESGVSAIFRTSHILFVVCHVLLWLC
jgi:hypothetical protein